MTAKTGKYYVTRAYNGWGVYSRKKFAPHIDDYVSIHNTEKKALAEVERLEKYECGTAEEKLEQIRTLVQNEKAYADKLIEVCPLPQAGYEEGITWLAEKILAIINQKGET